MKSIWAVLSVVLCLCASSVANAELVTIDFQGISNGVFASGTEDGVDITRLSGDARVNPLGFNAPLSGKVLQSSTSTSNGATVRFNRPNFPDFEFVSLDGDIVGQLTNQSITVNGYYNGSLIGTDVFDVDGAATFSAINLAGMTLDRIEVTLSSVRNISGTMMDNLVLNFAAVPEPSSVALLGIGLASVLGVRRRRRFAATA